MKFDLHSQFSPKGDQPKAIKELVDGLNGNQKNRHVGTVGKIGCLSFNGNKIITTGGGGMILTNNEDIAFEARYLTTQAKDDPIRYIHNKIGYNFRMTNIQAALGVAQLEQLPKFLKKKAMIRSTYKKEIDQIKGLFLSKTPKYSKNNYWLNLIQIDELLYSFDKFKLMDNLNKFGVQTRPVWELNHRQKPFSKCQSYKIEHAKKLIKKSLCLPSSVTLKEQEIKKVCSFMENQ